MNKHISVFTIILILLSGCGVKQKIVVMQDNKTSRKATLHFYENEKLISSFSAVVGRNGIAKDGEKKEGDGKTPSGNFRITTLFGKEALKKSTMPFIKTNPNIYCIDDTKSKYYNQIVDVKKIEKDFDSFEYMLRSDTQYDIGAVVDYNDAKETGKGSCIFIHIQKEDGTPTAGCVALSKEDLNSLLNKLDISKNPHIEIKP